jgi:organic hydroperoxide reductase OsmC/OhrA
MGKQHTYETTVTWTGNRGTGTSAYRDYDRDHEVAASGRAVIAGSSDPAFRGDPSRWNPEQLLVVSVSQCHMLWYLHLCAVNGVVVRSYVDDAVGVMEEGPEGAGRFTSVTLRPAIEVASADMAAKAAELHEEANRMCFIANSVNFPVHHEPVIRTPTGRVAG